MTPLYVSQNVQHSFLPGGRTQPRRHVQLFPHGDSAFYICAQRAWIMSTISDWVAGHLKAFEYRAKKGIDIPAILLFQNIVRKRPKRASWPGVGTARSISLSRTLAGSRQPQMQLTSCGVTVDMKKHYNHSSTASSDCLTYFFGSWRVKPLFRAALRVQNPNIMIVEPRGGVSGAVNPYSTQPPQGPHQASEKEANGQSAVQRQSSKTIPSRENEIHRRRCHGPQRLFLRFGAGIQATEAEDRG
ncbi:hypothetical protein C8R45DRAFT_1068008 [Mycena sanguinolenta]|nr:hypothetical protein C8R45DRAFT_1068008 [Mycena sanguinolenta]